MEAIYTNNRIALSRMFLIVSFLTSFFSQGQDVITVEDKIVNERIGDCVLKRILATHDGRHGSKTFEVDVPSDGNYYLGTIISTPIEAGKPKPIQLLVDGKQINDSELLSEETGFQNVSLRNSASKLPLGFFLAKGTHQLKFDLDGSAIPLIDGIRLAQQVSESTLTDVNQSYIDKLKQNKLEADYLEKKKKAKGGRQLANPEGNYYHDIDLNLTYTYSTAIYFTQGTTVTFETRNSNTDPVMYLFQRVPSGYYINIS